MDKKPQMMICPKVKECITPTCPHMKPHKHFGRDCDLGWCLDKGYGGACIPYVEPSPKDKCPECGHEISDHNSTGCWNYDFDKGYCGCGNPFNSAEPQPEPMPLIESPQNPYPEDIFTFTIEDYVKAIPDEHLRTGISGAVGRYVFNLCCGDWQKLIAEWLPAHDQQVRKDFAEQIIARFFSHFVAADIAHLRAMAKE
jgi:hypothetical protein